MNNDNEPLRIVLTAAELSSIRQRLLRFTSPDHRVLNKVLVTLDGTGIRWIATDSSRTARMSAGTAVSAPHMATAECSVSWTMPVRTLVLAWQMCDRREADSVTITVDGNGGVLALPGVELTFETWTNFYPDPADLGVFFDAADDEVVVTLAAEDLFAVIHGAALHPPWQEAGSEEQFVIEVDVAAGVFRAVATWDEHPDTVAAVACEASGDVRLGVNPRFLFDLAEAVGDDVITLHLSGSLDAPLRVEATDGFTAAVMPTRIGLEAARPAFEALLTDVFAGVYTEQDDDGDYVLPLSDDHDIWIRLIAGNCTVAHTARVFALLAVGVAPTAEMFSELNDLNRSRRFARVIWSEGMIRASCDVLLASLDADELVNAWGAVADLVNDVAPMLQMVHGSVSRDLA